MQHEVDELIDEVRVFYQSLVALAGNLHGAEITVGMRAVLELLRRDGPTTVPTLARARRVSRQRIQALVDACKRAGYVQARDNPAHARSVIIALTPAGRALIDRVRGKEVGFLATSRIPVAPARIAAAARTLRALRRALEDDGNHTSSR